MIGIVFIGNLKYCPYLSKYTQVLEQEEKEYVFCFGIERQRILIIPVIFCSLI